MIATILLIHISLAVAYYVAVAGTALAAAFKKPALVVVYSMFAGFGLTIVSGVGLVVVSPKSMAHFCVSTLVASGIGLTAWLVYKHRVITLKPAQNTLY